MLTLGLTIFMIKWRIKYISTRHIFVRLRFSGNRVQPFLTGKLYDIRGFILLTAAAPSGLVFTVTLRMVAQFFLIRPRTFVVTTATTATALSCHHEENCSDGNYP
jgi:hypothetical protein